MRKSGENLGMVYINRPFRGLSGEPQHDAIAITTLRPISGDHVKRPVTFVQRVHSSVHLSGGHLARRRIAVEPEDPQLRVIDHPWLGGGGVGGGHLNCALGTFLRTLVRNYTPVVLRLRDVSVGLGVETTICGMSLGA